MRFISKTFFRLTIINNFIKVISNKYVDIRINKILLTCLEHKSSLNVEILYRNVSIKNIVLIKKEDNNFLINLNLIIKINNNQASNALNKIEIKIFITIDALLNNSYTFMYDFQLFF